MTALEQYLSNTDVKDIKTLAYLTGIDINVLKGVSEGKLSLGKAHKKAIKGVVSEIPDIILSPKHYSFPSDVVTDKGKIPEGTILLQLQASEVVEGDLLLASHQTAIAGSHWAVVSSIREQGKNLILSINNDIEIGVSKTNLVKVARRNND